MIFKGYARLDSKRAKPEVEVPNDKSIEQVLDGYRDAVGAKDVGAFTNLYDEDVVVFDMWGPWSYDGLGSWRNSVTEWFGSLGDETVAVGFSETVVLDADQTAAVHTQVSYMGMSLAGEELRSMTNRLTWVLKRQDDSGWKIIHEHSSAPLDFETGKVVLNHQ